MITKCADWQRPALADDGQISASVSAILSKIKSEGDPAIENYALQFDGFAPKKIELKAFDNYQLAPDLAEAIKLAAARIEKFALFQKEGLHSRSFDDDTGSYGQVVSPIERVGAYIPGGRFPLISTALMTLIPARVAGSPVRIACSPSDNPALLAAASLAGATEFIQIGGVQAIAALTFGFNSLSPVDIVVGPGNAWVNEAKKQLQGRVKIDGLAGPSELLAICDKRQPIEWLAMDALAQAEHDPLACSLLVSDNLGWLEKLRDFLQGQENTRALLDNKQVELILADSTDALIRFSENYAPEHLMLCHHKISPEQLNNYGSLFIGANSAVALGDYISGPNHTLPTLGFARQSGGLSVASFLRIKTVQQISDGGLNALCGAAAAIAQAEGLKYHRRSLQIRENL